MTLRYRLTNFAYLQILDLLTTMAFLMLGVSEANPIVVFAMSVAPNQFWGLVAAKLAAMMLGLYCWFSGRERTLGRINILFAAVVVWNLWAIIAAASTR
ncbi:MAG: DUF5658 family protein [Bryobacteraceae bacterium]|nr:DUF5658 family protein [Bryobacteraceae bacterium]